jgi:hypothetical protein
LDLLGAVAERDLVVAALVFFAGAFLATGFFFAAESVTMFPLCDPTQAGNYLAQDSNEYVARQFIA